MLGGGGDDAFDVGGLHTEVAAPGFDGGAGVAGGDEHLVDPGRLRQGPCDRMFAPATTDDQDGVAHQSPHTVANCSFVFSVSWTKRSSSNGYTPVKQALQ